MGVLLEYPMALVVAIIFIIVMVCWDVTGIEG